MCLNYLQILTMKILIYFNGILKYLIDMFIILKKLQLFFQKTRNIQNNQKPKPKSENQKRITKIKNKI